jgi:hypothetical protein
MQHRCRRWKRNVFIAALGAWMWQAGCVQIVQRELEVLLRPEANPTLIHNSALVNLFGPKILTLFQ